MAPGGLLVGEEQPVHLSPCVDRGHERDAPFAFTRLADEELVVVMARSRRLGRSALLSPYDPPEPALPPDPDAAQGERHARRRHRATAQRTRLVAVGTCRNSTQPTPTSATPNTAPMSARPSGPVLVLLPRRSERSSDSA